VLTLAPPLAVDADEAAEQQSSRATARRLRRLRSRVRTSKVIDRSERPKTPAVKRCQRR
jgi:transcription elongation GreA/GreB family factor